MSFIYYNNSMTDQEVIDSVLSAKDSLIINLTREYSIYNIMAERFKNLNILADEDSKINFTYANDEFSVNINFKEVSLNNDTYLFMWDKQYIYFKETLEPVVNNVSFKADGTINSLSIIDTKNDVIINSLYKYIKGESFVTDSIMYNSNKIVYAIEITHQYKVLCDYKIYDFDFNVINHKELKTYVPRIESFTFDELNNIEKHLTKDECLLLEVAFI